MNNTQPLISRRAQNTLVFLVIFLFIAIVIALALAFAKQSQTASVDDDVAGLIELEKQFYTDQKEYSDVIHEYQKMETKWSANADAFIDIRLERVNFINNSHIENLDNSLALLQDLEARYGNQMTNEQLLRVWSIYRFIYYELDDARNIDIYNDKIKNLVIETNEVTQ